MGWFNHMLSEIFNILWNWPRFGHGAIQVRRWRPRSQHPAKISVQDEPRIFGLYQYLAGVEVSNSTSLRLRGVRAWMLAKAGLRKSRSSLLVGIKWREKQHNISMLNSTEIMCICLKNWLWLGRHRQLLHNVREISKTSSIRDEMDVKSLLSMNGGTYVWAGHAIPGTNRGPLHCTVFRPKISWSAKSYGIKMTENSKSIIKCILDKRASCSGIQSRPQLKMYNKVTCCRDSRLHLSKSTWSRWLKSSRVESDTRLQPTSESTSSQLKSTWVDLSRAFLVRIYLSW
jgi:hypothetical protein